MQSLVLLCFAAIVACAYSKVYVPPGYAKTHPHFNPFSKKLYRHRRDWTWSTNAGRGTVFGTLGSNDDSLYGRGGYKQDIFKDGRGHLQGQAYGSRVLVANGDSSILGGRFDWSSANDNARAALDLQKQIGGRSSATLTGDGVWKLDRNTRFNAGGNIHKNFGHDRPEIGIQGGIEHDF